MHIEAFTPEEQKALRECVASVKALPIFESAEFEQIFGCSRQEVEEVLAAFPDWDLYDEAPCGYDASGDVLRNAFAWLLNGDEEEKKKMYACLSFDVGHLPELYAKLQK
jgi:hypothetical protein